jgi:hypothetical protein
MRAVKNWQRYLEIRGTWRQEKHFTRRLNGAGYSDSRVNDRAALARRKSENWVEIQFADFWNFFDHA